MSNTEQNGIDPKKQKRFDKAVELSKAHPRETLVPYLSINESAYIPPAYDELEEHQHELVDLTRHLQIFRDDLNEAIELIWANSPGSVNYDRGKSLLLNLIRPDSNKLVNTAVRMCFELGALYTDEVAITE